VSLEHNHVYRVMTEAGEVLAELSGRVRHLASGSQALPVVGDWVGLLVAHAGTAPSSAPTTNRATICLVLPRTSAFSRQEAGRETREQVIAANIDTVLIVSALDAAPNLRSLERYLILARQGGARPVIILNKADLCADVPAAVAAVAALAPDLPVHASSTHDGRGFDTIAAYCAAGQTVAFLGPSGVGKSSIINRLLGHETLKTAEVRAKDRRGRHTSVHRQMLRLEHGGLVIDTPGMRELQLWDASASLGQTFADVEALGAACRFRDCRHAQEPGCAVKQAVANGQLAAARYESYIKLAGERDLFQRRHDEQAQLAEKRLGRAASQAMKSRGGQ
jgi:ribosome biogenesis GTPase